MSGDQASGSTRAFRVLHTSDWHLGRQLYGRRRYEEQRAFLDWLIEQLELQRVGCLVVAGDIFDTTVPSNQAAQLLFDFLVDVSRKTNCQHVVLTAGNHDSVSFLEAPRQLLGALDIHLVAEAPQDAADCVVVLHDRQDRPALIVAAVPFLRDRDVRRAGAGESSAEKEQLLLEGIATYYARVGEAVELRNEAGLPVLATGHLFTAGGRTVDEDGVRELYVGSLGRVPASDFPACFDYVALGHLHIPQIVGGMEHIRYSGSPYPVGFGEAKQTKQVLLVDFEPTGPRIEALAVPRFQALARLRGNLDTLCQELQRLVDEDADVWLELVHEDDRIVQDLAEQLDELTVGSRVAILRVQDPRATANVMPVEDGATEQLSELTPQEVFERRLALEALDEAQQDELRACFAEIIHAHAHRDLRDDAEGDGA